MCKISVTMTGRYKVGIRLKKKNQSNLCLDMKLGMVTMNFDLIGHNFG